MGKYHQLRYGSSPVKFSIQQVIDYPFHWHDCIEVIFVLKGSVLLELVKDPALVNPMTMSEDDIYVATMNEIHRIYKTEEENTVLLMQIDADFVRQHFAGVDVIEFSCLFTPDTNIEKEKIREIKEQVIHLSRLVLNAVGKNSAEIERETNEMLFNLIENFNIINRALARLSESKKYIARFTRISNYIIHNFNNKNVLQEIAEHEYLDAEYISHELKRYFGSSFQVAINFYRIENSMRLLLDSELTIDQIAYECGFSAPKYFYRNFKVYFAQGPLAFRQRYKKLYENMKYLKCYEETDIPPELLSCAQKTFETEIEWLEIDVNDQVYPSHNEADTICIGRGEDLCNVLVQNSLKLIQNEIGFKYIKIKNLFPGTDSFWGNAVEGIYYYLNSVDFLWQLGIKPIIRLQDTCFENAVYRKILTELINHFAGKYGWDSLKEWNFEIEKRSGVKYDILADIVKPCSVSINTRDSHSGDRLSSLLNDTFYTVCDTIDKAVNEKKSMDSVYPIDYGEAGLPKSENNIFQGKSGLMTVNGLLKPSFYAFFLLAQLGDSVMKKGDYYFVSKKGETVQILLYNHINMNIDNSNRHELTPEEYYKNLLSQTNKKINLNIRNVQDTYKVTRYELNYESNCIYYQWLTMRGPQFLNDHDVKLLNKVTFPNVSFDFIDKKDVNFNISLPPDGIELVILEKQ